MSGAISGVPSSPHNLQKARGEIGFMQWRKQPREENLALAATQGTPDPQMPSGCEASPLRGRSVVSCARRTRPAQMLQSHLGHLPSTVPIWRACPATICLGSACQPTCCPASRHRVGHCHLKASTFPPAPSAPLCAAGRQEWKAAESGFYTC